MEHRPHTAPTAPTRDCARAGVARLAERFARERWGKLAGIARRCGVPGDAVDDVVQDGLLGFIQAFPGDPDDERGAWAYLCRAVQTRAWRHHRTARRRPVHRSLDDEVSAGGRPPTLADVIADVASPDPVERAIVAAQHAGLRELFLELPADWRAVLGLGALGYESHEIARLLGMTERQVRKRVEKAHARLTRLLEEQQDLDNDAESRLPNWRA